jgi:hypothetical protein
MNSTISILAEFQSELEAMKKAREEAYKHLKYESKLNAYKLNSALKYETHIRTEKHAELQAQLSSISTSATTK